jgi:hypothetical protein
MILRGQTPRTLSWIGLFAVLALGAALLPLVPSWAQQPLDAPPADEEAQPEPKPSPANLEKQKQHLQKMMEELQRKRAEIELLSQELHKAMENIKRAEQGPAKTKTFGPKGDDKKGFGFGDKKTPPFAKPGFPGQPPADMERRLKELEQKVDVVLSEILALRRELSNRPKGPAFPTPKAFEPGKGPKELKPGEYRFEPKKGEVRDPATYPEAVRGVIVPPVPAVAPRPPVPGVPPVPAKLPKD